MTNLIHRWFAEHPQTVGETYAEHLEIAVRFGLTMLAGAFACFVHALVPALFQRTGSGTIKRLYAELISRQPGNERIAHEEPGWQPEYEI